MEIPQELLRELRSAKAVCVLTGAGVSAESGVPTFRNAQTGLWKNYDPTRLATPEAFAADPKLVWDWYAWRRELVAEVEPNPAHLSLAELEYFVPKLLLVTQSVDSLHRLAGSRDVVELCGNIGRVICSVERTPVGPEDFIYTSEGAPPGLRGVSKAGRSVVCGAAARWDDSPRSGRCFGLRRSPSGQDFGRGVPGCGAGRRSRSLRGDRRGDQPGVDAALWGADFMFRRTAEEVLPDLVAGLRE